MRPHRLWLKILALLLCLGGPLLCQESPALEPLPDTSELVTDLWGNEVRLYYDLPDNLLVFTDPRRRVRCRVPLGATERNDLMLAYLRSSNLALGLKPESKDPGFSVNLRGINVTLKAANREKRIWVVFYFANPEGQQARFAVPQAWDLKDPKVLELAEIKRGFERLILKAGL